MLRPRVEGVLEVGQRGPGRTVDDGDHVETRGLRGSAALREIVAGGGDDPALLAGTHGFLRSPEGGGGPGADLHEDQELAFFGDDVDLAAAAAMIARDDAVTGLAQVLGGGFLAKRSEAQ